ncbi:MAG: hypothetical protein C0410_09680 [Anaerolinea sp.]|nr:hypothetical protein [Anaerolinea sp.]
MDNNNNTLQVRLILENFRTPEKLINHPWTKSIVLQTETANDPTLREKSPGHQLILALVKLFRQLMPSTTPKRGKRLDTNWGQFGILAAQYFAPFVYGTVPPSSLRDAGGRIDQAIIYFVFNKPVYELSENDIERYKIIGDEAELIPISTLSDWHTQGIQKLAEAYFNYEQFLNNNKQTSLPNHGSSQLVKKADFHGGSKDVLPRKKTRQNPFIGWCNRNKGWITLVFAAVILIGIGTKGARIYNSGQLFLDDLKQIKNLSQTINEKADLLDTFDQAQALITRSKADLELLHSEVKPFLWLGRVFFWVPKCGGDLAQANLLFSFADGLMIAADETARGASPIFEALHIEETGGNPSQITPQLVGAQPHLLAAQAALDVALDAYRKIDLQKLSPKTRELLIMVDPWVKSFDTVLTAAIALPKLLGATDEGPKTYIVLLQNEDELRATGGFITGVATIVLENGKIISFKVEDSTLVDNPEQFYPPAPWQLERYMAASHWVFRDSNWSPDFPTAAKWAEMFIATSRNYTVDGVIAVDQESIKYILKALGPISVENSSYPITADNVINYMRITKSEVQSVHRKDFMADLAQALLQKIQKDGGIPWKTLGKLLKQALEERHILIQVDDPTISSILARLNWDGALRTDSNDYLFVVDSNLGFSKVNAVVNEEINYAVDLSLLDSPSSVLSVTHKNNAIGQPECNVFLLFDGVLSEKEAQIFDRLGLYGAQINRCYLDYLRIYKPVGVELVDSSPHVVPAEMSPWNVTIPAKVDDLIDENYPGVRGYGTLFYVPGGESLETKFKFQLPASVIETANNVITYRLHIQKQSGTVALPVKISIQFPDGAELIGSSLKGTLEGNNWTLNTELRTDIELSLTFKKP